MSAVYTPVVCVNAERHSQAEAFQIHSNCIKFTRYMWIQLRQS